jgi:hypothetical protein
MSPRRWISPFAPPAARRRLARPAPFPIVCLILLAGCLDTLNASRADTPRALLQVADSLEAEHFGGSVYIEQPRPDVLRLSVRDPGRCGDSSSPLRKYATDASQRALALFRPRPNPDHPTTPIREVVVRFRRTHRFGALAWTTSLGSFTFEAAALRALPPPAAKTCEAHFPALLRPAPDTA